MFGIPFLHPVLVHFPVAFLMLSALTAFLWLSLGKPFWRRATALLLLVGVLGGFAAYYTGDDVAEAFKDKPAVKVLVDRHEDAALWTMIMGCIAAAAFIAANVSAADKERKGLDGPDRKPRIRALLFLLALAAAVLVGYTGHLGGLMVWGTAHDAPPALAAPPARP
ncbi:MAG: DUF2231 domain-containing protein [Acidobacteria bacterium]|jgi:uncharacterized membrane protein|nr:DUF2231 domain-containing protein [Acidobacteriota bacterium]